MSRITQVLIGLVLLAGVAQWLVPRWAAGLLAHELSRLDHGPKPRVAVEAMPFWELFQGRFQDVTINLKDATVHSFQIGRLYLNWAHGQVALGPLEKGQLKVGKPGHLIMTVVLTGPALSKFIAKEGSIGHPRVVITPSGVGLQGQVKLGNATVPLNTHGSLAESKNHQALIFHPTSIDGIELPAVTDVVLVNLKTLNLPMPLAIQHVRLQPNQLALTIGN